MGLPDGVPIWIDERVMKRQRIVLGGGGRDRKLIAAPQLLTRLANAHVVRGLAVEIVADGDH